MIFDYRICGIPCKIRVDCYHEEVPGRYSGHPEDCYPSEPEEIDFTVLDRRGRNAPWLHKKAVDEDEIEAILDEIRRVME